MTPRWITTLLLLLAFSAGCAALPDEREAPLTLDFGPPAHYHPDGHVIVFFIDGLEHATFHRLLGDGRLPNIQRYFVERGIVVRNAASGIPSLTYANKATFLTGLGPGHSGVPGLQFVDRHTMEFRCYASIQRMAQLDDDHAWPNLFEVLGDEYTATILSRLTRGATQFLENYYTAGPAYFFRMMGVVDRLSIVRFESINDTVRLREEYPRFVLTHLIGPDTVGHWYGSDSDAYIDIIVHADAQIGRLLANMENEGVLDIFTVILISDHGHTPTEPRNPIPVARLLDSKTGAAVSGRLNTFRKPADVRTLLFEPWDILVSHAGDRQSFVYVRARDTAGAPRPWRFRPSFDELANYRAADGWLVDLPLMLSQADGIDIAAAPLNSDTALVYGKRGIARIDRQGTRGSYTYAYRVIHGADPLRYDEHTPAAPLVGGAFHDGLAWLRATCESAYPDAVVGLMDLFDSPRAGDIALFAEPGRQFGATERSGHGGLNREDMLVPFMIAGPGIRQGELDTARTVDLFPTVLELLGHGERLNALPPRDGRSLYLEIREP